MKEYIERKFPSVNHHLTYKPRAKTLDAYVPNPKSTTLTINSIITDNEALSVTQALKNLGCDVKINKQIHWEIEIDKNKKVSLQHIDKSGELYNSNKEFIDDNMNKHYDLSLIVIQKDDVISRIKCESLTNRFEINGIKNIRRGVVWNLSLISGNIQYVLEQIINTNILYNQQSHECYRIN